MRAIAGTVLGALLLWAGGVAWAQLAPDASDTSITALGQATQGTGDPAAAKAAALDDAFRQSVVQAAQSLLGTAGYQTAAADIGQRVLPKARSYVITYRILSQGTDAGVLQVKVDVQLDLPRLAQDLVPAGAVSAPPASAPARTTIVLMVADEPAPGASGGASPEAPGAPGVTGFAQALSQLGFDAHLSTALDDPSLVREAQALGAPVAVSVAIQAQASGRIRGTELVGAEGTVRVGLLDAQSGQPIGGGESVGPIVGYGDKPADAVAMAQAGAAETMLSALGVGLARAGTLPNDGVLVCAEGVASYADLTAVTRALTSVPGVAGVSPWRFAPGEADLLVRTARSPADIRDTLARAVVPTLTLLPDAAGAEPDMVRVRVVPQTPVQQEPQIPDVDF
jgi:hypothetical protein